MYYFVSFQVMEQNQTGHMWTPAQGVINRHPFDFIKDQGSPMHAVLNSFQVISEEEYELYSTLFNH